MNARTNFLSFIPTLPLKVLSNAANVLCFAGEHCAQSWNLHVCTDQEPLASAVARVRPDVLCFEVHPDDMRAQESLTLTRLHHPDLPIVLISQAPSEALALASLRLRVRNLLVMPLVAGQLDEILGRLAAFVAQGARQHLAPRMSLQPRRRSTYPAMCFIHDNVHRQLTLAGCARICNLSPCEFSRRFRVEHAVSFSEYVLRLRVERAATLLAESERTVSEVAYSVGFNDLSYFTRVFRRFIGTSASLYRQSLAPVSSVPG